MAYGWMQDVPITMEMYQQIRAELGTEAPGEMIVHVVSQTERGLRYVSVWESKEAWERFRDARLHPAVGRVFARNSFQPPAGEPPMQELDVREVWKP
jgi:heme-degrading monooxygenase HmoA